MKALVLLPLIVWILFAAQAQIVGGTSVVGSHNSEDRLGSLGARTVSSDFGFPATDMQPTSREEVGDARNAENPARREHVRDHVPYSPQLVRVIDVRDRLEHPATTYEVWAAIRDAFPPEHYERAQIVAWCESRNDPAMRVLDVNGKISAGTWSVQEDIWGAVPPDILGQAQQVARILRESRRGWGEWSCGEAVWR